MPHTPPLAGFKPIDSGRAPAPAPAPSSTRPQLQRQDSGIELGGDDIDPGDAVKGRSRTARTETYQRQQLHEDSDSGFESEEEDIDPAETDKSRSRRPGPETYRRERVPSPEDGDLVEQFIAECVKKGEDGKDLKKPEAIKKLNTAEATKKVHDLNARAKTYKQQKANVNGHIDHLEMYGDPGRLLPGLKAKLAKLEAKEAALSGVSEKVAKQAKPMINRAMENGWTQLCMALMQVVMFLPMILQMIPHSNNSNQQQGQQLG